MSGAAPLGRQKVYSVKLTKTLAGESKCPSTCVKDTSGAMKAGVLTCKR